MQFSFNFYSSLLLIFFVHGLVYAVLCLVKSRTTGQRSYAWLSLYLLLSVLFVAPWMLGFAGWYDQQPYRDILLYTPTRFTWALGPVMFIYVQSLLNPSYRFSGRQWWHLAPMGLYLLLHLYIVLYDKVAQGNPPILYEGVDPDYSDYNAIPGTVSMIVYFILALRYYRLYRQLMVQVVSYADLLVFRWVRNFLTAFLGFIFITLLFEVLGFLVEVNYSGSWWYYLAFALIFYYIAITGYTNAVETSVSFQPNLLSFRPALLLKAPDTILQPSESETLVEDIEFIDIATPEKVSLDPAFPLESWKEKVQAAMVQQRGYEDPDLTLMALAKSLGTNPSILSKVINQGFGKNFNDYINDLRVAAVQEKLRAGEAKYQTLLSIAFDCGFNSKATFNRAFSKATGKSPRDWMKAMG